MQRKDAQKLVSENGGINQESIKEGTNYLVTNNTETGSKKNLLAEKYNTRIITEEEFLNLF